MKFTGLATSSICFCASISLYLGSLSNDMVARLVSSHPLTKVAEDEHRLGSIGSHKMIQNAFWHSKTLPNTTTKTSQTFKKIQSGNFRFFPGIFRLFPGNFRLFRDVFFGCFFKKNMFLFEFINFSHFYVFLVVKINKLSPPPFFPRPPIAIQFRSATFH